MAKIDDAIKRMKVLECPTGDLENRLAGILENYEVANRNEITVNRAEQYDRDEAQAYNVKILNDNTQTIVILAKSGIDDYVAKVIDAYVS